MRFVQWPADQQQHDLTALILLLVCRTSPPHRPGLPCSPLAFVTVGHMQHLSVLHKPLPFQRLSWHRETILSSALSETCFPDGRGCYV